jgi:NADH-quinone oxidoreductase subunit K
MLEAGLGNISITKCLLFSNFIFCIGLFGALLNDDNFIVLMLCVELILLSAILNCIFFSIFFLDPRGELYALTILTAEASVGLGLLIASFKLKNKISFANYSNFNY